MRSNAASCSNWRLYVIVDGSAIGARSIQRIAAAAIRGGADVLQLRDKTGSNQEVVGAAKTLLALTRPAGIPLIINDRADIANEVGADGVHVGQDDLSVEEARKLLGLDRLIGKSTHSLEQAEAADREGADYIGVGPIFATPTKPDYPQVGLELIGRIANRVNLPAVCIGGIDLSNLEEVLHAGAERVAVVRAVCAAKDPESATRQLRQKLAEFHRPTAPTSL